MKFKFKKRLQLMLIAIVWGVIVHFSANVLMLVALVDIAVYFANNIEIINE